MTWTDILVILFPDYGNSDSSQHSGGLAVQPPDVVASLRKIY